MSEECELDLNLTECLDMNMASYLLYLQKAMSYISTLAKCTASVFGRVDWNSGRRVTCTRNKRLEEDSARVFGVHTGRGTVEILSKC